jgi:hypothetical protein
MEKDTTKIEEIKQFLYEEIIHRRQYSASKSFEVVLQFIEELEQGKTCKKVRTPVQIVTDRINAIQSKISTYRSHLLKLGAQGQFYQYTYSQIIALNCAKLEELRIVKNKLHNTCKSEK